MFFFFCCFSDCFQNTDGNNPSQFGAATASTTTSDRLFPHPSARCRTLQGGERAVGAPAAVLRRLVS
ncbi:hypothetical protein CCH79_00019613, partial [Gambusia affinis]